MSELLLALRAMLAGHTARICSMTGSGLPFQTSWNGTARSQSSWKRRRPMRKLALTALAAFTTLAAVNVGAAEAET
jgi:hypothetical protein